MVMKELMVFVMIVVTSLFDARAVSRLDNKFRTSEIFILFFVLVGLNEWLPLIASA